MVSADNLNLDVLELIFTHLSRKDLPSVALVSSSFLAGAIPRLYHTLSFRVRNAKRYPEVSTSFASILSHPSLAVHVRKIDVRVTPLHRGKPHPMFMQELRRILDLCLNMETLIYTPESVYVVLQGLSTKHRLKELRLNGNFTTQQAEVLTGVKKIERLTIDSASPYILDVLPKWMVSLSKTLTNLTLFMCKELNRDVLKNTLEDLPNLTGLHVVSCQLIDHITLFSLLYLTPSLGSLALTANETTRKLLQPTPTLLKLHNLAINLLPNNRSMGPESHVTNTFKDILNCLKPSFAPVASFSLKLNDTKTPIGFEYIQPLIENYDHTLKSLAFFECNVSQPAVVMISLRCLHLEKLAISLPVREIFGIVSPLTDCSSLTTLIDLDVHANHEIWPTLKQDHIKAMMQAIPNLRKIVTGKRIWTGQKDSKGKLHVSFEHQTNLGPREHWFMPHD